MKVCIVGCNTIVKDKRILTEAQILTKAENIEVVVIGLLGANQEANEQRDGFYIKRIKTSSKLITALENPLLRWVKKPLKTFTIYTRLFKAMLAERADYYHTHFPAYLMFLTFLTAKLLKGRYIADYNDILILEQDSKNEDYYEQQVLWGGELNEREQLRIDTTLELIPEGVNSILDIGCGDGRLTNKLAKVYPKVVGVDISEQALQYIKTEKIKTSVDALPFGDNSFDLILSTELIEHLSDEVYRKAITEMKRVARKWILIGTPWKEQLSIARARCVQCGVQFHLNYHYRNFDYAKLYKIFVPEFSLVTHQQTGNTKAYYSPCLLWIKRHLGGIWARSPNAVCPHCKTRIFPGGVPERNAVSKFCDEWNAKIKRRKKLPKSHVVMLCQRRTL